jgi:hypothetical protein
VQAMQGFEDYAKRRGEVSKLPFVRFVERPAIPAIEELRYGEYLAGVIA